MPLTYIKPRKFVQPVSSLKTVKRSKTKIPIKKTFEPLLNSLGYAIKK